MLWDQVCFLLALGVELRDLETVWGVPRRDEPVEDGVPRRPPPVRREADASTGMLYGSILFVISVAATNPKMRFRNGPKLFFS